MIGMVARVVLVVLSRVIDLVNPGPIDDLVQLGSGGRDVSAIGLLFRLTPLYGSQFVFFKGILTIHLH